MEAAETQARSAFELRLFGQGEGRVQGVPLPRLRARVGLSLLALLALHPHQPLERSWIAAMLWPDSSEEQARYNLRRNLVDLRHALGDQAWRLDSPTPRSLRLNLDSAFCDLHTFDQILHAPGPTSKERWETAVALYRGPLLEGNNEDWIVAEREAREQQFLVALEALGAEALRSGSVTEAIAHLRRVVALDPYRETAQRALMEALVAAGDWAAVTLAYRSLRLLLAQLRSEPSPETRNIYQTLRQRIPKSRNAPLKQPGDSAAVEASREEKSPPLWCPLTSFVGRYGETQALRRALNASRLVTLIGPGGVGKTRLAIAAIQEKSSGDNFPDGVRFVDLAPIRDGEAVPQAVAAALGLNSGIDVAPEEELRRFLGHRRLLLVLDNAEQVADACARLAAHLLRSCPMLRILCTSRQPLHVPGEKLWVVPPLSVPPEALGPLGNTAAINATLTEYDAVRLLLDRVCLISPSFRLTERNAAAIARLCRQVDGLPLALELVAALFRSLTVQEIVDRLDGRLRLLAGGDPSLPRQRTLQAAIEWSYDLLGEAEQTLLRRLSVFAGGWTLEAAEAVCPAAQEDKNAALAGLPGSEVLRLMVSLIDKSLVVWEEQDEQGRYRLLETTRDYASLRLSLQERQSLQERHAGYFLNMARALAEGGTEYPWQDWPKRFWIERENFRTAHAWCSERDLQTALWLEFTLYNTRTWPVHNARAWIARLQQESMPPTRVGALVTFCVGSWALWLGDPASELLLKQALEVTRAAGDHVLQMNVFAQLTHLEAERGNRQAALEYAEAALGCAVESGDKGFISEYNAKAALMLWQMGDRKPALQRLRGMLREGRQTGDWHLRYFSLWGLGEIALEKEAYIEARACLEEVLPLAARYVPFSQPNLLRSRASVAVKQQDYSAAWRYLEQALAISQQLHAADREGWTRWDMAELAFRQGNMSEALQQLRHCLLVFESIQEPRSMTQCLQKLAKFCAAWGEAHRAAILLASAERACQEQNLTVDPATQQAAQDFTARLRDSLCPVEWQAARKQGTTMTLAQATAYARSILMPPAVVAEPETRTDTLLGC